MDRRSFLSTLFAVPAIAALTVAAAKAESLGIAAQPVPGEGPTPESAAKVEPEMVAAEGEPTEFSSQYYIVRRRRYYRRRYYYRPRYYRRRYYRRRRIYFY